MNQVKARFLLAGLLAAAVVSAVRPCAADTVRPAAQGLRCEEGAHPIGRTCHRFDARSVQTPSSPSNRQSEADNGFAVGDGVTVDGKTNFNDNRFGQAPLQKLTPRPPSKASSNGGAQLDFKF